jgi:glycosyltransferase involved in cell wall biosynthesis
MPLRILIISRTPIGDRMSSPGIRYVNMKRVLEKALPDAKVTLAVAKGFRQPGSERYDVLYYEPWAVLSLIRRYDVVISMSFPFLMSITAPLFQRPLLVLDFFSQFHIEWMEVGRDLMKIPMWTRNQHRYANLQLLLADYIICANERQRDSYIGVLASLGRLTPATYDADPTLRRLIDVGPHGVRPEPLPKPRRRIKGVQPGIEEGDKLLLWLGGILFWYDPVTLLRALARVRKTNPEVKLLFVGGRYPGMADEFGLGARYEEAVAEAKRLGLWETGVFMIEEWLPHEEVVDYLLDSDVAVTTYFTNAETRFAHRTRFLDYIWAGLPILCTAGDVLADEVTRSGWGIAVPERDEDALTEAILQMVTDDAFLARCRKNLRTAAKTITWEAAFEPLVQFLAMPGGPQPVGEGRRARWFPIWRSTAFYLGGRLLERGFAALMKAAKSRRVTSR